MKTYNSIKEFGKTTNLNTFDIDRLNRNIEKFTAFIGGPEEFMIGKDGNSRITKNCAKEMLVRLKKELGNRTKTEPNESKNLHSNILTKPKNVSKLPITNETTTNNSKQETKTMAKNTNTLTKTETTANIFQLTELVNKILDRLDALEAKNVAPKNEIKKLRETAEEVKKEPVKKTVKKVKTANAEQKSEIVKLQKKAQAGKKSLTKKQLAQYTRMWHAKWQEINKSIDINDKAARSLAFAKGRIACLKKARTY